MNNLQINQDGLASKVSFIHSPNQDPRPAGNDIKLIVIHNISLPPNEYGGNGVIELFTNQLDPDVHPYYAEIHQLKVSSHFFIRRDGGVTQFVPCTQRAWHAGASNWQEQERCNDFSIGIELEGSDFEAFEIAQYIALNQLVSAIKEVYPIQDIVGHSDIAPGRKTDPGPYFDWSQLKPK
ncbi:MAG: 1,6-anhydro-N-acetylmuramyl-L-alanine amidase AmpD [Methylophilaceae bacterium]|nr:1,6-anhydro-N-acetylmuramyl-L-alanine amidase AmpD [Methyloradius sp.]